MPAARYWRVSAFESVGGGDLSLTELQLWDAAGRVDTTATITSSHAPSGGSLAALSDGDTSASATWSALDVSGAAPFWIQWDLGSTGSADALSVLIGSGLLQELFPYSFVLSYSTDGIGWVGLYEALGVTWPGTSSTAQVGNLDPLAAQTRLILNFEEDNGALAAVDTVSGRTFTSNNAASAYVSTSQRRFGSGAAYLGAISTRFSCPANNELNPLTQLFTLEFWRYHVSAPGTYGAYWVLGTQASGGVLKYGTGYGTYYYSNNSAGTLVASTNVAPANTWQHMVLQRPTATKLTIHEDGQLRATATIAAGLSIGQAGSIQQHIGTAPDTSGEGAVNYLDGYRLTVGAARYPDANFTPPDRAPALRMGFSGARAFRRVKTGPRPLPVGATSDWPPSTIGSGRNFRGYSMYGGRGVIYGSTKNKGTPSNTPVGRKVRLFREGDGYLVAETWSDAVTGSFAFTELDPEIKYTVISFDHTGSYRGVIADRVTPALA
ncbi:MAG: discoidin domain-containing protein [Burkholderiales bacterium]|nr:discoidin domain-containing protein [Burkholderiales bacterium]